MCSSLVFGASNLNNRFRYVQLRRGTSASLEFFTWPLLRLEEHRLSANPSSSAFGSDHSRDNDITLASAETRRVMASFVKGAAS